MQFADVILPLAIPYPYTYRIPHGMEVTPGMRVSVQLGKSKIYMGMVFRCHNQAPESGKLKDIIEVLDEQPLATATQLEFWSWLSAYYMCGIGEVMQAALPTGLKLQAETSLVLGNPNLLQDELTLDEKTILAVLHNQQKLSLRDVEQLLGKKNVRKPIRKLSDEGFVQLVDKVSETYQPATRKMVCLSEQYNTEQALEKVFAALDADKRNTRQVDVLLRLVSMLHGNLNAEVTVKELLAGASESAYKTLVKKGVLIEKKEEVSRFGHQDATETLKALNPPQIKAYDEIRVGFGKGKPVLLHGVTSSGKTEIFVHLIQEALQQQKQVLYLLPEIALTTQLIERLRKYFGNLIGVYHSKFSSNERTEVWRAVLNNELHQHRIILGARSSLFLPFQSLGLVIIDEEHENSFKQYDPAPRYHARDAAVWLASKVGAKVLMGSATPSVESYWNAQRGKYHYVSLTKRHGGLELPLVEVIDLKREYKRKRMNGVFSQILINEIGARLEEGRQVILFQNRRGFSPFLQCEDCGHVPECPHCDVKLTYHKGTDLLKCHYCGTSHKPTGRCEDCGSSKVKMVGYGTERIEEEIEMEFPDARIGRLDLDTVSSRKSYERILTDFSNQDLDVLIGTQMVTKGLDFDHVGLVGILGVDRMLNFQDFRAHERAFQLMAQVAGRAGRSGERGKVLIQTYTPDHWVIQRVVIHDSISLMEQELLIRKNFHYPPFVRLIRITLRHRDAQLVLNGAKELADMMKNAKVGEVLGPESPVIARVMNQFHQQLLLKLPAEKSLSSRKRLIADIISRFSFDAYFRRIRVIVDVDPF